MTAPGPADRDSHRLTPTAGSRAVPRRQLRASLRAIAFAMVVVTLHGSSFELAAAHGTAATDAATRLTAPRSDDAVAPTTRPSGFVTRVGTQLMLDGRPFRFTGLNIYNANSRDNCWYSMGYNDNVLDASLIAIGPAQTVFRAWFFQRLATRHRVRDWSAFDRTLAVAARHGQRVIATLADQWGACEDDSASIYKVESWYQSGYRTPGRGDLTSYRDWVAEVVSRYRDDPTILMWQLMNEAEVRPFVVGGPCGDPSTLKKWADDLASLVKRLDPHHLVSVGTIGGSQCGVSGPNYVALHSGPDIDLCEYHEYWVRVPMPGDPANGLPARLDECNALGKPLFVGEIGVRTLDAGSYAIRAWDVDAKIGPWFAAGVVGVLYWGWRDGPHGGSDAQSFDVGPCDPLLRVLEKYLAFDAQAFRTAAFVKFSDHWGRTVGSFVVRRGRRPSCLTS